MVRVRAIPSVKNEQNTYCVSEKEYDFYLCLWCELGMHDCIHWCHCRVSPPRCRDCHSWGQRGRTPVPCHYTGWAANRPQPGSRTAPPPERPSTWSPKCQCLPEKQTHPLDNRALEPTGETKVNVIMIRNQTHDDSCKMSPELLLTGGMVQNLSLRTAASQVEGINVHQVCVAALAVVGAIAAGGVARLLAAVTSLDEGWVAVSMRHRVPRQSAVSFWRLHEGQRLRRAGV